MNGHRVIAAIACVTPLWLAHCDVGLGPVTYADPTEGNTQSITLRLVSPAPYSTISEPHEPLSVEVTAEAGVASVVLALDEAAQRPCHTADSTLWTCQGSWLTGDNAVELMATDTNGRTRFLDTRVTYAGQKPTLRVTTPSEEVPVGAGDLLVTGAARPGQSPLATLEVSTSSAGPWSALALTEDGSFSDTVPPPSADAAPTLYLQLTDEAGEQNTLAVPLTIDTQPPSLAVLTPSPGQVVEDGTFTVSGDASDEGGVARVEVQVDTATWITASGTEHFEVDVRLDEGTNTIAVRCTDIAGNTTEQSVQMFRAQGITLQATSLNAPGGTLSLTLDRAGLEALIPEETARDLILLNLDIRGLLLEGMKVVKDVVLYGVDTSGWNTAAWNLHHIMTMTPDTVDVSGTAMAPMLELAAALGLPVPTMLSEMAGIPIDGTFLTVEELSDALYRNVIASHPAMVLDATDGLYKVPVSLWDALRDLETLDEKLGPSGDHPGFLSESTPTAVLLPNFAMTASGQSNLALYDGVNLSEGKAYLFTKPEGAPIVTFDFLDPKAFDIAGLADEPEVDLAVRVVEHDAFVDAGDTAQWNLVDGAYKGNSEVWFLPPWTFEHLVADAVFQQAKERYADDEWEMSWSWDIGATIDACVVAWERGWVTVSTTGGIGTPPAPAYWWDLVSEMAQVRLHDGGLAEGEADMHLTLTGVRVPITAEELTEAARPVLEDQKDVLSEALVGDHSTYDSDTDFFLVRGEDASLYLFFVDTSDTPGEASPHPNPGFFNDPTLQTRVSTTADLGSGDSTHEKIAVAEEGATLYVSERDGSIWRVTVMPPLTSGLELLIAPVGEAP